MLIILDMLAVVLKVRHFTTDRLCAFWPKTLTKTLRVLKAIENLLFFAMQQLMQRGFAPTSLPAPSTTSPRASDLSRRR